MNLHRCENWFEVAMEISIGGNRNCLIIQLTKITAMKAMSLSSSKLIISWKQGESSTAVEISIESNYNCVVIEIVVQCNLELRWQLRLNLSKIASLSN